ncbi:MAG: efflux RND transporter periplasmic adaptor subunit [Rhodocyclaceae bacterium]|nr:efflux RND transporter periplasmic adaptor subunit [Rhodocyclaceae bacterium]
MKIGKSGLLAAIVLAAAVLGFAGYRMLGGNNEAPRYKFAKVERGPLNAQVSASGTLNPVVSVQVGSQVSGQIKEILVDFNSEVKAGQLIARLDPETFEYRVRQAEADLEATRSAVLVQKAEVFRARVNLADAERDFERKKLLVEKNFISPADRDKALTVMEAARAQLQVAEAQVRNSEATVRQREAQLAQARVDLARTEIRAPVNGVVVKRSIEPGQTVAASLQAPELFVIARNLTDMQVETSIDEADVGRIRLGQKATFTVDAFPGRSFEGQVMQIRKAAQVVSNVVTYTVIVSAGNPELILLPGMTANVRILTQRKDSVLKISNAALRFKPAASEAKAATPAPEAGGPPAGGPGGQLRERLVAELKLDADQQGKLDSILGELRGKRGAVRDLPEVDRAKAQERLRLETRERINGILNPEQQKRYVELAGELDAVRAGGTGSGRLWVADAEGRPKAIPVRLGISDGTVTEIVSGEVGEGMEIIVGTATGASVGKAATAPGPRMF